MRWLKYKAWISNWLMHPISVILVLLLAVGLTWSLTRQRRRRILTLIVALPLLCYGVAFLPPVVALGHWGLTHGIPADTGETADAIVLLGRGEILGFTRVLTAVELWQQGRAPLVFASGNGDGPWMERWLLAKGIPEVQSEGCSRTTEENAQYTAALLHPQGVKRIILVTDPPHLLRSWLTFRSLGFTVIPHASPPWPDEKKWVFPISIIREYVALISYGALGRFHPRSYIPLQDLLLTRPGSCPISLPPSYIH
jgi:uncharacterized SAM-binding protein YcdF (DUF218 family)